MKRHFGDYASENHLGPLGGRTHNLQIRSQTPYPLGYSDNWLLVGLALTLNVIEITYLQSSAGNIMTSDHFF